MLSKICFFAGLLSIPLSVGLWVLHPDFLGTGLEKITDEGIRAAMISAHAERWGIFVGLWPATLLILSTILKDCSCCSKK